MPMMDNQMFQVAAGVGSIEDIPNELLMQQQQ
jgi:hypothetical protein